MRTRDGKVVSQSATRPTADSTLGEKKNVIQFEPRKSRIDDTIQNEKFLNRVIGRAAHLRLDD